MKRFNRALAAAALVALAGCGSAHSGPSVSACTKAYPAWFLASEAAGTTTPAPASCKGLTSAQITTIAESYLANNG